VVYTTNKVNEKIRYFDNNQPKN